MPSDSSARGQLGLELRLLLEQLDRHLLLGDRGLGVVGQVQGASPSPSRALGQLADVAAVRLETGDHTFEKLPGLLRAGSAARTSAVARWLCTTRVAGSSGPSSRRRSSRLLASRPIGLAVKAEAEVDLAHGVHQGGLDLRLGGQLVFDPPRRAVEDVAGLGLLALGAGSDPKP